MLAANDSQIIYNNTKLLIGGGYVSSYATPTPEHIKSASLKIALFSVFVATLVHFQVTQKG